jgi:uncharacterized protein YbjQ (UPF0145 family)
MDNEGSTSSEAETLTPMTPPMIIPEPGKGMTPIRHGERFILGYDSSTGGEQRYYVAPRRLGGAKKASWYPLDESGWASAWREFANHEPNQAANYARKVQVGTGQKRTAAPAVPLLTIPTVPGQEITQVLGLVTASAVVSRNMFSDLGSDVSSVIGGNLEGVEKAITKGLDQVRLRMYQQVEIVGGNCVVGLSVQVESVADKAQAIILAGTAVRISPPMSE